MAIKPGDILRDKYRIDALIGRGGMGHVFAATALDTTNRTQVAIKIVSRLLVDDILMVRLHREAEAASRIRSEYVPQVLEVSDTEDGETFLVMERLVGEPLSQRIRDHGALPWSEVARVGQDVLRGLIDAHAAGIVHRDLKPSNVFLALKNSRLRAMVLDFGVCKMDGLDTERLTGTGESIGTVAYMAPEQIRGAARVDERADLFAFGVLVFEMLTGRLPHDGPSQMAILASKLENPAAPLRDCTRVNIPEGLDELVGRALERDPDRRFATAQDVMKAWRMVMAGDRMLAATSSQPADTVVTPRSSEDDVTTGRGFDAPTQVSRPASASTADMSDTDEDLAIQARRSRDSRDGFQRPKTPGVGMNLPIKRGAIAADTVREERDERDFLGHLAAQAAQARSEDSDQDPLFYLPQQSHEGSVGFDMVAGSSPSSLMKSVPPEPHPTQNALITQAGSGRRGGSGARIALVLAACGLVAGVIVVGVSFTRDPATTTMPASNGAGGAGLNASSSSSSSVGVGVGVGVGAGVATAATDPSQPAEAPSGGQAGAEMSNSPTPAATDESFELPADPAQPQSGGGTKPRVRPVRPGGAAHHPATGPASPKTSGPRITSQPRY